jgi:hypothetical protein
MSEEGCCVRVDRIAEVRLRRKVALVNLNTKSRVMVLVAIPTIQRGNCGENELYVVPGKAVRFLTRLSE